MMSCILENIRSKEPRRTLLEVRALASIYDELKTPEGENIVCN